MTNRDLTYLILIAIAVVVLVATRTGRALVRSLAAILWGRLLVAIVLVLVWVGLGVGVGIRFGLWSSLLIVPMVYWLILVAVPMFESAIQNVHMRRHLRQRVLGLIGLSAAVDFVLNYGALPLAWELLVQVGAVVLGALSEGVKRLKGGAPLTKMIGCAGGLLFVLLLGVSIHTALTNFKEFWSVDTLHAALLPIWMTLWLLPCVLCLSLYSSYESLTQRSYNTTLSRRRFLLVVSRLRASRRRIALAKGDWMRRVRRSQTEWEASEVLDSFVAVNGKHPTRTLARAKVLARNVALSGVEQRAIRGFVTEVPEVVWGYRSERVSSWQTDFLLVTVRYFVSVVDEFGLLRSRNGRQSSEALKAPEMVKNIQSTLANLLDVVERTVGVLNDFEPEWLGDDDFASAVENLLHWVFRLGSARLELVLLKRECDVMPVVHNLLPAREKLASIVEDILNQLDEYLRESVRQISEALQLDAEDDSTVEIDLSFTPVFSPKLTRELLELLVV